MRLYLLHNLWLFIIILSLNVNQFSQYESALECQLDFCNGTSSEESNYAVNLIGEFCNESYGILNGRCCSKSNETVGLDLSNCSLHTLHNILANFTSLQFLDLNNNTLENCIEEDFLGISNLVYLYIPESCTCPGNYSAWNHTSDGECFNETNPCHYLNVSCTDNGHCLHLGPGSAECVCLPQYYGYKCLREGSFPYGVFVSLMVASTASLSSLLWYFIGRHAKRD